MSSFDLRQIAAEVPLAEGEVYFTFELALAKKVRELRAGEDEEALAAAEAELKAKTFKAELMSVPRRRREDIYEASLQEIKGDRDFLGRVTELTEFQRGNYVRKHMVAAALVRIVSPESGAQEDNLYEAVEYIHDKAPDQIFETLERKVKELNAIEDEQTELNKSTDF